MASYLTDESSRNIPTSIQTPSNSSRDTVLVIPHSNAGQERLFSIVRKNKTDSRSSLKLDGSLFSILAMKCHNPEAVTPCYKWQPHDNLLQMSKSATKVYNNKHKKQ